MAVYSRFWAVFQHISHLIGLSVSNYYIFKTYVTYTVRKHTAYWWEWTPEHTLQATELSTSLYSSSLAWGNYKKEKSRIIGWRHIFSPKTLLSLVIKSCKGFNFINWGGYRGTDPISCLSGIIINKISGSNLIFLLRCFIFSSDCLRKIIPVYVSHSWRVHWAFRDWGRKMSKWTQAFLSYFLGGLYLSGIYQVQRAPGRLISVTEQCRSPQEIRTATTESKAHPGQGSLYKFLTPAEECGLG